MHQAIDSGVQPSLALLSYLLQTPEPHVHLSRQSLEQDLRALHIALLAPDPFKPVLFGHSLKALSLLNSPSAGQLSSGLESGPGPSAG